MEFSGSAIPLLARQVSPSSPHTVKRVRLPATDDASWCLQKENRLGSAPTCQAGLRASCLC